MNSIIYFGVAIAIIISIPTIVFIHQSRWGNRFISATKTQRYRTIQRIYVQCRMERARTTLIGKDERFAVGDGAWRTVRAQYPEGV